MGFYAGDSIRFYEHPYSQTSNVLQLTQSSNVGLNGRWIYRIDGPVILTPGYVTDTASVVSSSSSSSGEYKIKFEFKPIALLTVK
jgi:hypothetical protein